MTYRCVTSPDNLIGADRIVIRYHADDGTSRSLATSWRELVQIANRLLPYGHVSEHLFGLATPDEQK